MMHRRSFRCHHLHLVWAGPRCLDVARAARTLGCHCARTFGCVGCVGARRCGANGGCLPPVAAVVAQRPLAAVVPGASPAALRGLWFSAALAPGPWGQAFGGGGGRTWFGSVCAGNEDQPHQATCPAASAPATDQPHSRVCVCVSTVAARIWRSSGYQRRCLFVTQTMVNCHIVRTVLLSGP